MAEVAEAYVIVSGRVQGVWFRETRSAPPPPRGPRVGSQSPDRRVEAVLQGERVAVERVIDFMRTGRPGPP